LTTIDPGGSWRKSSKSMNSDCLEFTSDAQHAYVRDSKGRTGPILRFALDEWRSFVNAASRDGLVRYRERGPSAKQNGLPTG
jgi:hypothetical protein